jgi:hypothetical protein
MARSGGLWFSYRWSRLRAFQRYGEQFLLRMCLPGIGIIMPAVPLLCQILLDNMFLPLLA